MITLWDHDLWSNDDQISNDLKDCVSDRCLIVWFSDWVSAQIVRLAIYTFIHQSLMSNQGSISWTAQDIWDAHNPLPVLACGQVDIRQFAIRFQKMQRHSPCITRIVILTDTSWSLQNLPQSFLQSFFYWKLLISGKDTLADSRGFHRNRTDFKCKQHIWSVTWKCPSEMIYELTVARSSSSN